MIFHIVFILFSFQKPDSTKERFVVNKVPFGQIEQIIGINKFKYGLTFVKSKLTRRKYNKVDFTDSSIEIRKLQGSRSLIYGFGWDFFSREVDGEYLDGSENKPRRNFDPFPARLFIYDFDSLADYLRFLNKHLASFNGKTITIKSEKDFYGFMASKYIQIEYYDPRPLFGKDIIHDFQKILFASKKIHGIGVKDSLEGFKKIWEFRGQLEEFLKKYPQNPYLSSIHKMLEDCVWKYSAHTKIAHLCFWPLYKKLAALPQFYVPRGSVPLHRLTFYLEELQKARPDLVTSEVAFLGGLLKNNSENALREEFLNACKKLNLPIPK